MELAREVQAQLVPAKPPKAGGLSLGAFYRAAAGVGGDLCDCHLHADGRCGRGEAGGREGLSLSLARLAPDRPDGTGLALAMRRAVEQAVGRPHDDIALVVVKVL